MADRILDFMINPIKFLKYANSEIEKEINLFQFELSQMNSFIWYFEGKNKKLDVGNEMVSKIRDIANETEDVIDSYQVNLAKAQADIIFWGLKQLILNMRTYVEIERVRKRILEFHINKEKFSIQITQARKSSAERLPRFLIANEEEIVSFDHEEETIIHELTNGEPELLIIPIVGMGGVGKTTLARKVFDHHLVVSHFNFRAWVRVGQDYNVRELLEAIIKCSMIFTDEMKEMSDVDLGMMLRVQLRSTRYLIVLDDLWKIEFWDELSEIFAKNLNGSRIVITTQNKDVVLYVNPSSAPHHLSSLNEDDGWALLSKKVFRERNCTPYLEEVGKKIVKQCRGLPLAINLIAGVLVEKDDGDDWHQVLSRVNSFGTEYDQWCMDILTLSYDDLPGRLKWCFLYFAIFPEDFEVPTKQLIRLWVAEGLVKREGEEPMEFSAEEYLAELIDRNLIQATKFRFNGTVKACRMHDLVRDLCILKAKEEKFLEVRGNVNPSSPANSRRLAIHSNGLNYISSNPSTGNIRSFLCFGGLGEAHLSSKHWKLLYKGFPLIRVLDLLGVTFDSIPSEFGKLIHIRYLRLKSHTAKSLPSSICNLQNLQILEVRAPLINRPQIVIWKMQQLRHLKFSRLVVLPEPGDHDDALDKLKTLLSISPDNCTVRTLSRFPNLVKLGIYGDLNAHMDGKAFKNISLLDRLQTLKLERDRRCQSLSSLDRIEFPKNITKITLSETQLSSDPMQKLGLLPELQVLKLINGAYEGDGLHCSSGGFPQLKVLKLINLRVKKWDISSGSMASLQSVVVSRCSNLEGLPSALQHMPSLRKLELWWPNSLVLSDSRAFERHIGKNRLKLTTNHSEN